MMCKRLWQTQKSQEILKERAAETRVRLDRWSVVIRNGVMADFKGGAGHVC